MDEHFSSADSDPRSIDPPVRESTPANVRPEYGGERRASNTLSRLTNLLMFLAFLLLLKYLGPYFAEQIQYAMTRGRQRAAYEMADERLKGGSWSLPALSLASQTISHKVFPSVVHINTKRTETTDDDMSRFLGRPQQWEERGQGAGVIVDAAGYIVTNEHVILDSNEIYVSLSDGRNVSAEVIGTDKLTDLAVLKIEADDLVAAEWGDSDEMQTGALVWAVGSPFGLDRSITSGILSGKHRSRKAGKPHQDFLQTDAAVNPGNSGGPLVDVNGQVVGINTAIVGTTYQGISFAIPSAVARKVYEDLRSTSRVSRGWLGVELGEINDDNAEQFGLDRPVGTVVSKFINVGGQSPAALAGVEIGDVILQWNETPVTSLDVLSRLVAATKVGSTAELKLLRAGEEVSLSVTITERPARFN